MSQRQITDTSNLIRTLSGMPGNGTLCTLANRLVAYACDTNTQIELLARLKRDRQSMSKDGSLSSYKREKFGIYMKNIHLRDVREFFTVFVTGIQIAANASADVAPKNTEITSKNDSKAGYGYDSAADNLYISPALIDDYVFAKIAASAANTNETLRDEYADYTSAFLINAGVNAYRFVSVCKEEKNGGGSISKLGQMLSGFSAGDAARVQSNIEAFAQGLQREVKNASAGVDEIRRSGRVI